MKKQNVLFIGGPCNGNTALVPWPWYGTGRVIRPLGKEEKDNSLPDGSTADRLNVDASTRANEYVTREFHLEGKTYLIAMQQDQPAECISQHIFEHRHTPVA